MDVSMQAENFRKMLLTLNDDVRVIIIKIADRLHNMQTMASMRPDKQVKRKDLQLAWKIWSGEHGHNRSFIGIRRLAAGRQSA